MNISRREELMEAAVSYARAGLFVVPLHWVREDGSCSCASNDCEKSAGKHPIPFDGFQSADNDEHRVRQFWRAHPDANIGIRTGQDSGIFVVDVDPGNGGNESFSQLESEICRLPETLKVDTGGGGRHFYFKCPTFPFRNTAGKLPGIDTRGDGGMIVAPPSNHRSGRKYEWSAETPFDTARISEAPEVLVNWFRSARTDSRSGGRQTGPEGSEQFRDGNRNASLTSYGGRFVRAGVSYEELLALLQVANRRKCVPPLAEAEVAPIAASLFRYRAEAPTWGELGALPEKKTPVMALTPDMLPAGFSAWIIDASERMQVSPDLIAIPALCAFSGVLGRKVRFNARQLDDWTGVPNLWGAIVAPPSALKSACISEAFRFVYEIGKEAKEAYLEARRVFAPEEMILEAKIAALKKAIKHDSNDQDTADIQQKLAELMGELSSKRPVQARYFTNDATTEKLAELLGQNPNGLIVVRDELAGLLTSMEKKGRESDRAFFLEAWSGDGTFTSDRIGRGTTEVPRTCLTVVGGIQPDVLAEYFARNLVDGSSGDGFLARFQLLVSPDQTRVYNLIDRAPNREARAEAEVIFRRARQGMDVGDRSFGPVAEMKFSMDPEAQEFFNRWFVNLESRLRSDEFESSSAFAAHMGKYRSLMPSLALLFHIVALYRGDADLLIDVDSCTLAAKWCEFLESHARRVYAGSLIPEVEASLLLAERISSGEVIDLTPVREIYRKGWKGLTAETIRLGAGLLAKINWARIEILPGSPNGGQPSEVLRVNPAAASYGGARGVSG